MDKRTAVICSNSVDPYYNLALEEHLLNNLAPNMVLLYLWQNDHTVVIGKNQNTWAECRTAILEEDGGHIARRLSGGGAVYHDLGNLNFTFLCYDEDYDLKKQLSVIQKACGYAGIRAEFSGRNDLLAEGRKFSGNAFYHSKGRSYHHGTILIHTDAQRLQRYLSPPKAKLETKGIASVRSRVINLRELVPTLSCDQMKGYMQQAFSDVYGGTPEAYCLTEEDQQAVCVLKTKYSSSDWLFGKPLPFSCAMEDHFSWGHISIQLLVEKGVIQAAQVYTDAMDAGIADAISDTLTGCAFQTRAMEQAVSSLSISGDLIQMFRTL